MVDEHQFVLQIEGEQPICINNVYAIGEDLSHKSLAHTKYSIHSAVVRGSKSSSALCSADGTA